MDKINKFTCFYYFLHLQMIFNTHLAVFSHFKTVLFHTYSANSLMKGCWVGILLTMTKNFKVLARYLLLFVMLWRKGVEGNFVSLTNSFYIEVALVDLKFDLFIFEAVYINEKIKQLLNNSFKVSPV